MRSAVGLGRSFGVALAHLLPETSGSNFESGFTRMDNVVRRLSRRWMGEVRCR